jgi:hypothetical protein
MHQPHYASLKLLRYALFHGRINVFSSPENRRTGGNRIRRDGRTASMPDCVEARLAFTKTTAARWIRRGRDKDTGAVSNELHSDLAIGCAANPALLLAVAIRSSGAAGR